MDYFETYLDRSIRLLGEAPLRSLRGRTVTLAGCGGVGGAVAIMLARMGVGRFRLADPGIFDEPDVNRQWAASTPTLGHNKALVYAQLLKDIDPAISAQAIPEGLTPQNLHLLLDGSDMVVDCLDLGVPLPLRTRMYREAMERGIYCVSAPIVGMGCFVAFARPGGMPMDRLFAGLVERVSRDSRVPAGFRNYFNPFLLDNIERHLSTGKVPSVAVAPALAGSLVSAEIALILLRERLPWLREPICLPELLLVDPWRPFFGVVDVQDLFGDEEPSPAVHGVSSPGSQPMGKARRLEALAAAGFNTNRLGHGQVAVDMFTDSWAELPIHGRGPSRLEPGDGALEARLGEIYGYRHIVPLHRGRLAEAMLASVLVKQGNRVLCNALFPTTRLHLESRGASLVDVSVPQALDHRDPHLFKGNLDIERLEAELGRGNVSAVYVELCVNATGGHPVSLANLRQAHDLASHHGVPLVLDGARAFNNAALLRARESGLEHRSLQDIVRRTCACSDLCATSLSKNFVVSAGAFVGLRDPRLFTRLQDQVNLLYDVALKPQERAALLEALSVDHEAADGVSALTLQVERLWARLAAQGLPLLGPAGGHALFLDVASLLPHLPPGSFRNQALANALYVLAGIRAGANMLSPAQERQGRRILRLALPLGLHGAAALASLEEALLRIHRDPSQVTGLVLESAPPGLAGQFMQVFRPAASSAGTPRGGSSML